MREKAKPSGTSRQDFEPIGRTKAMTKTKSLSSPSPRKQKFAAFAFTEEDERVEKESKIALSKFKKKKSPQKYNSPVSKYTFLSLFARGERNLQKEIENEVVDIDCCHSHTDEGIIKSDTVVSSGSSNSKPLELDRTEYHELESSSNETTPRSARLSGTVTDDKHLGTSRPLFPADNEPVIVDSDDDPVIESRSSKSPFIPQFQGLLEEQPSKRSSLEHVTEALVVVLPDHVIYSGFCSKSSSLEFSPICIQLDASSITDATRISTFKWMVSDIVCIESFWCDAMKTAMLDLHLKSESLRASDVGVLKIAVHDPNWSVIQEAIQSLDISYKVKWRTARVETMRNGLSVGQKSFEEPFHEVLYPKGDPDAISISKRDVDRLQPETFINDTIIDFYIMYLKNNIPLEERHRFHFFNCFFFRKLADMDKDPSQACEGRAAFQRVRRWTMKVDIFKKDYIFVPINFSLHWSLIVICHPGEVAGYQDDEMEKSSRVPCILHMDSLRGSHKGLKNLFQSYLWEEWKKRHDELDEDVCRKFLNLQFLHLKLPQQENSFDCGLFLLHYVELFVEQAPVNFSTSKISPKFLSQGWFQPKDVSQKRDCIRKLIYEILKQTRGDCSTDYNYKYSSNITNKEDTGVEFLKELCSSTETSQNSDSWYPDDAEVQIMSPPQTHLKSLRFAGLSDFVSRDMALPGYTPKSGTNNNYMNSGLKLTRHGSKIMSPIEEEEDVVEEFMDFSISSQVCPGETQVKSSSCSGGDEHADWIVLDSQEENTTCDGTPGHPFHQSTNTSFFCNLEEDEEKEEQAAMVHKIIDVSVSEIGNDECKCLVTPSSSSTVEPDAFVVEDSEDEEANVQGSIRRVWPLSRSRRQLRKTHMTRLVVDLSADLNSKQFL